ncbi:MAG: OmpA family protein [Desulfovibrionales bacterium]
MGYTHKTWHSFQEKHFSPNDCLDSSLDCWNVPGQRDYPVQAKWVLPWSDLMMVLFVLFCVLFVYSLNNPQILHKYHEIFYSRDSGHTFGEKGKSIYMADFSDPVPSSSMRALYARINRTFSSFSEERVDIGYTQSSHVTLRIKNKHLFASGKSQLLPESSEILEKLSTVLSMVKNDVQVVGHVDPELDNLVQTSNKWRLSAERAGMVVEYFTDRQGFKPGRFTVLALANTGPITPGKGKRAREINNRIEIRVMAPPIAASKN